MTIKKRNFILCASALTALLAVPLFAIRHFKWIFLGFRHMSRAESISCYISLFVTGLVFHLMLHKGKNRLTHVLLVAAFPVFFYFGFCQKARGTVYLVWGALGIFVTYLDVRYGKNKVSKKNRHVYFMHVLEKRALQTVAWIGLFGMASFGAAQLGNPMVAHQGYEQMLDLMRPDTGALYATEVPKLASMKEGNLWEGNRDTYVELNSNRYPSKTLEERLNLWQAFVAIECCYLGVEKVPLVGTKQIGVEGCHGYYDRETETIIISREYVERDDNQYAIIKTLMHECYHHYSNYCTRELYKLKEAGVDMNLRFAREISTWAYEQEHYVSYDPEVDDEEGYEEYEQQKLEVSATSYANEWAYETWNFIQGIEPVEKWGLLDLYE